MIERYTLPEMGGIWSAPNRFQRLLDVEVAVAQAQAKLKLIPADAAKAIAAKAKFEPKRIDEIEKTTKHDVIAFVSNVAENIGEHGRYLHFGLTSSDVLDTALSLQIRDAEVVLDAKLSQLEKTLKGLVQKYRATLCAGRTHGMHAEPTTLGFKFAGHLEELRRNRQRVNHACKQAQVVKLSGAVGTYSSQGTEVERLVAEKLEIPFETIATQVVPRDRHAEIFSALAILGAGFERLAVEIRHLQRTEVGELEEPFQEGQKGSSAMPHKRNPIGSENLTGLARLLRGYLIAALEDVALWHERDISHSSVERVIFPDAFILAHYGTDRLTRILKDLRVYPERMQANLNLSQGTIMSSHVLLELVKSGLSREEAYKIVQKHSHGLKSGETLRSSLEADATLKKKLTKKVLDEVFSGRTYLKSIDEVIERVLK